MQISHSRVECYDDCPFRYKLRYIDKIETLKPDNADNALYLGTALHTGIEKDVDTAIKEYYNNFSILTNEQINEAIKLEYQIKKAKEILPTGEYEVPILDTDFIGFIDLLVPIDIDYDDNDKKIITYDLYDFKYSNNVYKYKDSPQLHLYKYYFEKTHPNKYINQMKFVLVPKIQIKQKKTETLEEFRKRIYEELEQTKIKFLEIEYNPEYVINFLTKTKNMLEDKDFKQNKGWLCAWCEYQEYCEKGVNYFMELPKNERRNIEKVNKKTIWIYGAPFSGKTTFANEFPDPLMLNTDGNIKFVDAPYIAIKDEVTVTGRMTHRKLAWEVFKEAILELEKKENSFKTIVVDLLEDTYEYCRLYMYNQMGITHESDDSFRAWDKVRTEFLSTLKRLMNLDYENIILISHEDTSKDITKRSGDKITAIKPNLQEKAANKVAGMVDLVARVIADDDRRILSFKSDEVIFGGGRLKTPVNEIELNYDNFIKVYNEADKTTVNNNVKAETKQEETKTPVVEEVKKPEKEIEPKTASVEETKTEEVPMMKTAEPVQAVRTRKRRTE